MATKSEATTTLDSVFARMETMMNKYYERGDLADDIELTFSRVKRKFESIQLQIPKATIVVASNVNAFASLREMGESLKDKVSSVTRFNRVKRMRQLMDNCENLEDNILEFLREIFPVAPPDSSSDRYVPFVNIPPNPPRLTLDYFRTDTDEGRLKNTILQQNERRVIALIAAGQGGIGKTCAVRGLVDDEDIKTTFPDGLLYIQLGNDAKLADIIDGLANIVHETGGKFLYQNMRSQETLEKASCMAAP